MGKTCSVQCFHSVLRDQHLRLYHHVSHNEHKKITIIMHCYPNYFVQLIQYVTWFTMYSDNHLD